MTYVHWGMVGIDQQPDDGDEIENDLEQCAWANSATGTSNGWEDATCNNINPGVVCER